MSFYPTQQVILMLTEQGHMEGVDATALTSRMPEWAVWAHDDFTGLWSIIPKGYENEIRRRPPLPVEVDGVILVRNLLHPAHLAGLQKYITYLDSSSLLGGTSEDHHRIKRRAIKHDPVGDVLMNQLKPYFEKVAWGAPLRSSYSFFSRYLPGSELGPHKDIPECPVNISIQLDLYGDEEIRWPLYVQVNGKDTRNYLGDGDALQYRGTEHLHWRGRLPQTVQHGDMLLFHYYTE